MSKSDFKPITDVCLNTGRTFAYEARRLADGDKIDVQDPRFMFSEHASLQKVPVTPRDLLKDWREFRSLDHPKEVKASLLVAESALRSEHFSLQASGLAKAMESAAVHVYERRDPEALVSPSQYVSKAALFCDAAILSQRHAGKNDRVSEVTQQSGIAPQSVLVGMLRTGLIREADPRFMAFLNGSYKRYNSFDRGSFLKKSSAVIKESLNQLPATRPEETLRKSIGIGLVRLQTSRRSDQEPIHKEVDLLEATAILAENLSVAWGRKDPGLACELAGLSFSSAERGHLVRGERQSTSEALSSKKVGNSGR